MPEKPPPNGNDLYKAVKQTSSKTLRNSVEGRIRAAFFFSPLRNINLRQQDMLTVPQEYALSFPPIVK